MHFPVNKCFSMYFTFKMGTYFSHRNPNAEHIMYQLHRHTEYNNDNIAVVINFTRYSRLTCLEHVRCIINKIVILMLAKSLVDKNIVRTHDTSFIRRFGKMYKKAFVPN